MAYSMAPQSPGSMARMSEALHSHPSAPGKSAARAALVLVTLVASGAIDYATGYEVSVFLLYVAPVALCTRFFGVYPGLGVALVSTAVWMAVDQLSGHRYSQSWIWYVNAANRMICFVLGVWAISYFQSRQAVLKQRLKAFNGAIPICTQCHRLSANDGYWWAIDGYLKEFGGARPQHKVCPDCARHAYARGGYRDTAEQGH
ncbi:MAG: hypothetical protein ACM3VZ_05975 [Acidobacteriota bacterium]